MQFSIDHHATMYALLSKHLQRLCPERGLEILGVATDRYGRERGMRMARCAAMDGVDCSLEHYFAYVEWTDADHEMVRGVAQREPEYRTLVHRCGWVESWKKRGLLEYGKIYCQYADFGLVHGFNPDNTLVLDETLSHGDAACVFRWAGYAMTPAREAALRDARARVGERYRRDFAFHTGHLFSCLRDEMIAQLGVVGAAAADLAMEEFAEIFTTEAADIVRANLISYEKAPGGEE